jgi:8-oxo-dGTP diphosphatase
MSAIEFRYCPRCGTALEARERGGRVRPTCPACAFVQYRNPAVGVAVIVRRQDEVLLGRRRGSYADMWCIPCGYVEWDEDVRAAAVREFEEETGLTVALGEVVAVHSNFHNPAQHTVGVWFAGDVVSGTPAAADDLVELGFFALDALPEPLAFPTDRLVLEMLRNQRI